MNKQIQFLGLAICFALNCQVLIGQNRIQITVDKVVEMAVEGSPFIMAAKQQFNGSYWQYRSYIASYLPSVTLNSTLPSINRYTSIYINPDGTQSFVKQNNIQCRLVKDLTWKA